MQIKNEFNMNLEMNWKNILFLAFLAFFPNIFGLYNIQFHGINIHFFQYFIFLAALIYGPFGGLISGMFGSIYTSFNMSNPYILIGNMILGFFVGYFAKKFRVNTIIAVIFAFLIQLPWLFLTDVYLVNMPVAIVRIIIIALTLSNLLWAFMADITYNKIIKPSRKNSTV